MNENAATGHAFISYVREDAAEVDRLKNALEAAGIQVWRDTDQIMPGQDWSSVIRRAVQQDALVFLACFSSRSAARLTTYQNEELILAIEQFRQRRPGAPWLIPVRFDDCEVPDWDIGAGRTLTSIQQADLFGSRAEDGMARLVTSVLRLLDLPQGATTPRPRRITEREFVALSSYDAASALAAMPPDEAAVVLATAPPEVSAEVIDALLSADAAEDEALAVALLGAIHQAKAQQIIAAVTADAPWLTDLPKAAAEIDRLRSRQRAVLGAPTGPLTRAPRTQSRTPGFYRTFTEGRVYWCAPAGAQVVTGVIAECYLSSGGSLAGLPLAAATEMKSSHGTSALCQKFEFGSICLTRDHGAHAVLGRIGSYYAEQNGPLGTLGFPLTDGRNRPGSTSQRFEGGDVYASPAGVFQVSSRVVSYLDGQDMTGRYFPITEESDAAESPHGSSGRVQLFRRLALRTTVRQRDEPPDESAICISDAHGIHYVSLGVNRLFEHLGGTAGWLGFPLSDSQLFASSAPGHPLRSTQDFEGGAIFLAQGPGIIAVRRDVADYLSEHDSEHLRLGFPMQPEQDIGTSAGERVQFFEHGVVTVRGGTVEGWLRMKSED